MWYCGEILHCELDKAEVNQFSSTILEFYKFNIMHISGIKLTLSTLHLLGAVVTVAKQSNFQLAVLPLTDCELCVGKKLLNAISLTVL